MYQQKSLKTIERQCKNIGKEKDFKHLINLSFEEKLKIPNLIWQVVREVRRTIDVPLSLENKIDIDILKT